jgi:nucleoid DNA-binding protein
LAVLKNRIGRVNRLAKKVSKKINLNYLDVDAILKVASFELLETLKKSQKVHWDGLGVFYLAITDRGISVRLKLSDECYERLNKKDEDSSNEIIFE